MPTDLRRRDDIAAAVAAYDRANPMARAAAQTPHGCWPPCLPSEDVCQRSLEAIAAEGFDRGSPARGAAAPRRGGFLSEAAGVGRDARHLPPAPAAGAAMRSHPPREGVRPRPRRAAGPQRQGPHCRLRARLGPPAPPAGPERRSPGPRRPGRSGRPAVGVPQRPLRRLLSQLRDDRREGRLCPLAPSPRR